jgi:hypothetical protein
VSSFRVVEATNFGKALIGPAMGISSGDWEGQKAANSS